MKKIHFLLALTLLAHTACSLVAPYTITFTNTPGEVIDPALSTLDLVVSAPTLAYVSAVKCENTTGIELLPIVAEGSVPTTLHKLPLSALTGIPAGSPCMVTVTVFDPTTTEQASADILVLMPGEKGSDGKDEENEATMPEPTEAVEATENVESTENPEPTEAIESPELPEAIEPTSDETDTSVPAESSAEDQPGA